jgi:hypothetical protein
LVVLLSFKNDLWLHIASSEARIDVAELSNDR